MNFSEKLDKIIDQNNSLVSVGLDPDTNKIPDKFKNTEFPLFEFNKYIIDQTHDQVCAYKPNSAFYEGLGADGIDQLKKTCDYLNQNYSNIPIILDAKRGDIGNTNQGYIKFAYNYLDVDAITLHPYMGQDSVQPFLDIPDKTSFILCQNSNPGSVEFQSLESSGVKLSHQVAKNVLTNWNTNNNCALVVGATFPDELSQIRKITGENLLILVPGIGSQGGDLEKILSAGLNSNKKGLIIHSSRAIIYSKNPRQSATNLKNSINSYRD